MTVSEFAFRAYMKLKHETLRSRVKKQEWQYGVTREKRDTRVIISLTSFPRRFPDLELCLKSLFNQEMKADRIILWLGNDASAEDVEALKKKYSGYGLEVIRDGENNYFSHKKYYYAMRDFPEAVIVTADDDLIYPTDWLGSMYRSYEKNPDCINARRVCRIAWDASGDPKPYVSWPGEVRAKVPSHDLVATTGAGALFPPGCLGKETLNHEVFMSKAKTADDLWIKIMAVLFGVRVVWAENSMIMPTTINLNQDVELANENVANGRNDAIFRDLCSHYHLGKEDFDKQRSGGYEN